MEPSETDNPWGFTVVLDPVPAASASIYGDTVLSFSERIPVQTKDPVPDRIGEMRSLYEYENGSFQLKCKNFYRQGVFMQDYEDTAPWTGEFVCYFPTYRDLTLRQLRGYFSWRTLIRKGEYHPIPTSAAYLYVYELLNGIGAASPEESVIKLAEFEAGYVESGVGDKLMQKNIQRWMLDFAVLHDLSPDFTRRYAAPDLLQEDKALTTLRDPAGYTDEEVFDALCTLGGEKLFDSPVISGNAAEGKHLFSEIWRTAVFSYRRSGRDLFAACFGKLASYKWYPLANAIYYPRQKSADRDYEFDECRRYHCRNGIWTVERYESLNFDRKRFQSFLHAADRKLRHYLKTGRYLREKKEEAWAAPYIDAVIEADSFAKAEAAKPRLSIDISDLDRIRKDADTTRDSLLTEEERIELEEASVKAEKSIADISSTEILKDIPLDALQIQILRVLLQGGSVEEIIRENHLMPSIIADAVNEALFDEIGDTVLSCDDDRLSLVEDYRDDLTRMLGGFSK